MLSHQTSDNFQRLPRKVAFRYAHEKLFVQNSARYTAAIILWLIVISLMFKIVLVLPHDEAFATATGLQEAFKRAHAPCL